MQQTAAPSGGPDTSTGTEPFPGKADRNAQTRENTEPAQPDADEEGDLLLATCAEHLRHVARTEQQLMATLGTHIDTITAKQSTRETTMPTDLPLEADC